MALLIHSLEMSVTPQITPNPNLKLRKFNSFKPHTKGKAIGSTRGVRIFCKVKDCAVLDENVNSYGQFSVPVKQGSKQSKEEEEEKQNYYVNVGYAIRTLREEFPDLFYRELSFDIYRFGFCFLFFMIFIMVVECRRGECEISDAFVMIFVGGSWFFFLVTHAVSVIIAQLLESHTIVVFYLNNLIRMHWVKIVTYSKIDDFCNNYLKKFIRRDWPCKDF